MQWAWSGSFFLAKAVIRDLLLLLCGAKGQCFLELNIYYLSQFLAVLPELVMSPVTHVPCKYNKFVTGASRINSTQNSECFLSLTFWCHYEKLLMQWSLQWPLDFGGN